MTWPPSKGLSRFWDKVMPEPTTGCWLWTGAANRRGYGNFRESGATWLAHRYAFTKCTGSFPRGRFVLHLCDTPSCVNPDHLRAGTAKENTQQMIARGRDRMRQSRGVQNPGATLTRREVHAIRCLSDGLTKTELARAFGVSWQVIDRVVRGVSYRDEAEARTA